MDVKVIDNVLEVRISETDTDAHALLDEVATVKPNGNVRYYWNDKLISECLDYGWPEHAVDDRQYDDVKKDYIVRNVREMRLSRSNFDRKAILDLVTITPPNGNLKIFLDTDLIINRLDFEKPDSAICL